MGVNRAGSYVAETGERAQKPLLVIVRGTKVSVEFGDECELGFNLDRALDAKRAFVKELYRVSRLVARKQPTPPPRPAGDDAVELQQWRQELREWEQKELPTSLILTKAECLERLWAMRKVGAALRADLSPALVDVLRYNSFPSGELQTEPALAFIQKARESPLLWDMMYEGTQAGWLDWRRFWGFRAPLTHWVTTTRNDEIRLRRDHGVFSAVHEDLLFAGREVELLAGLIQLGLPHRSLAEALRRRVDEELLAKLHNDPAKVKAWWQARQPRIWLQSYLNGLTPDTTMRPVKAEAWKQDALVSACKEGFGCDLIHFACHACVDKDTEYLSRLDLQVAGEPVSLTTALMATDLRRQVRKANEPGPLVFLNACSTGRPGDSHDPPGLPDKLIDSCGALAVVATLCDVPDYFAHAFARKFYEILVKALTDREDKASPRNRYIAEAFLQARRHFMKKPYRNPLGLAYVLYAYRGAHVLTDFLRGGEP